jgi:hypothetical protein
MFRGSGQYAARLRRKYVAENAGISSKAAAGKKSTGKNDEG